jgi:glycosyltransferase involved in cell wall biosynthesis
MSTPRVSIGLPVYNGSNFLTSALDSLLAQTYLDFELIISDNASTDTTEEVCRDYASSDARIRYFRQRTNLGSSPNHNFVVDKARAPYFKWSAHDDEYRPELIARCVEVLDAEYAVVLCHGHMGYIDGDGHLLGRYEYVAKTDSPSAPERFKSLLHTDGGDDMYGLIRTAVLRRGHGMNSYHHPGRPFTAELALYGRFHQVPELLYLRRDHPDRGDRTATITELSAKLDPRRAHQSSSRLVLDYLNAYLVAVRTAPLSSADRRRCYWYFYRWLAAHGLPARRRRVDNAVFEPEGDLRSAGMTHPPSPQ